MQALPYPHTWDSLAWLLVATFVGGGGITGVAIRLYSLYLNRKKPIAEIRKTEAEAESLDVQADVARFDLVARMMGRLDEAHDSIEKMRKERGGLREVIDKQRTELELADYQLGRMSAFIKYHGLHYADADKKE